MPRRPRLDTVGAVHHVMARGIERLAIFLDDADREDLVGRITALLPATGTVVYAWSLLPNHFHLPAVGRDRPAFAGHSPLRRATACRC